MTTSTVQATDFSTAPMSDVSIGLLVCKFHSIEVKRPLSTPEQSTV